MSFDDNWSTKVSFGALTEFLESLCHETSKPKKTEKVEKFFSACRRLMDSVKTDSLFSVVRLLLPLKDDDRGAYGIKETLLAKLFIDMLKLGPHSSDAQKLKNYRTPSRGAASNSAGDFAAVLYNVVKDRAYDAQRVSVKELNAKLDEIVQMKASEGNKGVEKILMDLFRKLNAVQLKWLVRIILKDLKIGIGPDTVLNQLHPDAKELFNVNGSLRRVCETLRDPHVRLNEIEISLFNPFKPMLAETGKLEMVETQMGHKEFFIETKFDGERMQAHIEGDQFKFFSRNGKDFTDDFGDCPDSGKFCKYLARSLEPSVRSVILDGEICAYNHVTGTLATKSVQYDIRHIQDSDPTYQQCLCLYDILYLNGNVLTNLPYRQRLKKLEEAVPTSITGRVQFTERKIASTKREVAEALNFAIDRLEEGLVLKDPDSVYKPNIRNRGGWLKIKPEYSSEIMDMPDLLIMGGYYASGKRLSGVVSHFILGVAVKNSDDGVPEEFRSFCRVGSGYSNKDLFSLLQKLEPHFRKGKAPPHLKFGREKPDVWVDPKKSVVVQVKAAEIVYSDTFDVGCTLRFPRVEQVRYDKDWCDVMTYSELISLRGRSDGRLARKVGMDNYEEDIEETEPAPKKSRRVLSQKPAAVATAYKAVDSKDVIIESNSLEGKVVVVEPSQSDGGELKRRLERIAIKHGAIVEQNVSVGRTFCYVATVEKIKAKSVVRSGKIDVARSSWLLDCEKAYRPFQPCDMIFVTDITGRSFEKEFDRFGDGFAKKSSIESLKFSMKKVSELGESMQQKLSSTELAEFEHEYFPEDYKYGLFRRLCVYVDRYKDLENFSTETEFHPLMLTETVLSFYGARISTSVHDESVTHVVTHRDDSERLSQLRDVRRRRSKKFHLVTSDWVEDSLSELKVLPEIDYNPVVLD